MTDKLLSVCFYSCGNPKTVIDRLFDLTHHSRLDQLEAAFAALGKRLAVQIEDAA